MRRLTAAVDLDDVVVLWYFPRLVSDVARRFGVVLRRLAFRQIFFC